MKTMLPEGSSKPWERGASPAREVRFLCFAEGNSSSPGVIADQTGTLSTPQIGSALLNGRPCLPFKGKVDPVTGYGIQKKRGERRAHRVAYVEAFGPIPAGMFVLHGCDRRDCIESAHLRLGTHQENMADRFERTRQARGPKHGRAKLTAAQVVEIRALLANDSQKSIAIRFGVSKTTISNIATGRNHGEPRVTPPERRAYAAAGMKKLRANRRALRGAA